MMKARAVLLSVALASTLGACASFEAAACGGPDDSGAGMTINPPETIQGLRVKLEKSATKALNEASKDPAATYACKGDSVVYSLRDGKELRAVLQVMRLAPDARIEDRIFVGDLVRAIAGEISEPEKVGDIDVYTPVGRDNEQLHKTWFNQRWMYFLTVREDATVAGQAVGIDFDAVLREAVAIAPQPA